VPSAYTSSKSTKPNVVTFQKPSPYKPPVGFEKEEVDNTPKVAQIFEKSSLKGKQIWYFTAPASLPISSIGQVLLRDVRSGKAIVSHKENEYGFIRDSAEDKTFTKIMVPHGSDGYRIGEAIYHETSFSIRLTPPSCEAH
jgi:hypothetical protein